MNICSEILCMIEEVKHVTAPVLETSNLYTDVGMDSISFISLLLNIEERYLIDFSIFEMEECLQIDRLAELVEKKIRNRRKACEADLLSRP